MQKAIEGFGSQSVSRVLSFDNKSRGNHSSGSKVTLWF